MAAFHATALEIADWQRRGLIPADAPPVAPESTLADDRQSERAFMADVIREAKNRSWRVYHTHDSRKSTPGFPDLVLVRDRVIFAELKTATGRVEPAQQEWLDAITHAGVTSALWRPADWPTILETLNRDTTKGN